MDAPHDDRGTCPPGWLELLFEHSRDYAVTMLDAEGRVVGWPRSAQYVFGHAPADVLGRPFGVLFTPEDQRSGVPEFELAAARSAGHAADDRWHVRQDGSRFWASGVAAAIRAPGGELLGFAKLLRDRTDLRTQTETLRNQIAEGRLAAERRDAFAAVLAHELRNPLMPLKTALQLVADIAGADARIAVPLQIIGRQVAALERLVDDVLDMTRLHTGRLALELQPATLQDVVGAAAAAAGPAARDKGVALACVQPAQPIALELDVQRFQQVLANLLNNAVKFTPRGGHIWVKVNSDGGHATVRVQDDGQGIAAELQPRIFELFAQAPGAPSRRGAGLGIGLAVVKEIVGAHRGTVAVRSEGAGKGSEFVVRVPLAPQQTVAPDPA